MKGGRSLCCNWTFWLLFFTKNSEVSLFVRLHATFLQLTCSKPVVVLFVWKHQDSSCGPLGHFSQSGQIQWPSCPSPGPVCGGRNVRTVRPSVYLIILSINMDIFIILMSWNKIWPHVFMLCLASSMSFLISGVMVKCSFWGMGKGTMGERTISGFLLRTKNKLWFSSRLLSLSVLQLANHLKML